MKLSVKISTILCSNVILTFLRTSKWVAFAMHREPSVASEQYMRHGEEGLIRHCLKPWQYNCLLPQTLAVSVALLLDFGAGMHR